ncbi:MAG: hypothetical protein ACK4FM_00505 [Caldimicrobium sp.]
MGGRSRKSILKQKIAKYYRERENPLALLALQDEIVRKNQKKLRIFQENLEFLRELEKNPGSEVRVSKLNIRRYTHEPEKKFANRAFYESLYPITMEYRFMPLQAFFVWYMRSMEMIFGEKIPKLHLNRLQKWIKYWLSSLTPDQELQLKSAIISWIMNRFT